MSSPSIRPGNPTIAQLSHGGNRWLCLVAGVVTALSSACTFDADKLRARNDQGRDASSYLPETADVGGVRDEAAVRKDLGSERRFDGPSDSVDVPVSGDGQIAGEIAGDDAQGVDSSVGEDVLASEDGADDVAAAGTGGAGGSIGSGGAGGNAADWGAGMGGTDRDMNGGTRGGDRDSGSGGAGGSAGGGSGGAGGNGTGGAGGGYPDAALVDARDGAAREADPPAIDPDLVLWYRFDESSGTAAADSAGFGGVARSATLATVGTGSSVAFSTAKQVGTHALAFTPFLYPGGGGYVTMPTLHDLAPNAITIAVWLKLDVATPYQNWERIFDYGDSSTGPRWFNLAARSGTIPYGPIFAMSNIGHGTTDQQRLISSTAITANVWHHLAVVLGAGAPYTGVMFLDGVIVASNDAMTLHLSDIGSTANNWLGRSEFTTDPYFSGSLDDFRVYKRALTQQEIVALMAVR